VIDIERFLRDETQDETLVKEENDIVEERCKEEAEYALQALAGRMKAYQRQSQRRQVAKPS
jgi:hypothetical protein